MNNRIKELRECLKLTQTEFGEKIGRKLRAIQDYEYGKNKLDESMILLISMTFNVNPTWLRTGEGKMFLSGKQSDNNNDENNFGTSSLSRKQKFVFNALKHMSEEEVEDLLKYIEDKEAAKKYREMLKKEQAG